MSIRYDVMTPRAKKDGGTHWHRVGTGFTDDKGTTIYLDSSPYPDADGRVVLKLFEPRDNSTPPRQRSAEADRRQSGRAGGTADGWGGGDDSDIPFISRNSIW